MFEDGKSSDTPPPPGDWSSDEWAQDLQTATLFLTRIPMRSAETRPLDFTRAARAFPVVGALIGAASAMVAVLCHGLGMGGLLSATFGIGTAIALTGALHEDGLADTADGFWGATSKEEKLRIMRDSRIGTFGVLAVVFSVLIRIAAVDEITEAGVIAALAGLISAEAISRHAMSALMATTDAARDDGLAVMAGKPAGDTLRTSLLITLAIGVPGLWLAGGVTGIALAGGLALLAFMGIRDLGRRFIGGQSGDVCGAMQQAVACAVLTALAMVTSP
jgi:adenosylcobinamide-GDP ribazoletransferase